MPQRQTLTFRSAASRVMVALVDGDIAMSARLRQPYRMLAWRLERVAPLLLTAAVTAVALGGLVGGF